MEMPSILFLRDDLTGRQVLTSVIEVAVRPEQEGSVEDAVALIRKQSFDLVVAAYHSEHRNWSQILASFKGASSGSAVLAFVENGEELTIIPLSFFMANRQTISSVRGLKLGFDADGSGVPELLSGMRVIQRPSSDKKPEVIEANGLRLDGRTQEVIVRGRVIPLTALEFKLLHFLASHPRQIFSRRKLLEEVWGQRRVVSPRTIDVHMRRLREQIEEWPDKPSYLLTVRGIGYRFVPDHDEKVG